MKLKFLKEKSRLRRAALVYMLCKMYFTDDIANQLKLRITCDEWAEFKRFNEDIKNVCEFEVIKIIFYQLFTENFFNITMKNKRLALDYGSPIDDDIPVYGDQNEIFWQEIREEVQCLEKTDVTELKQLNDIRETASQPFKGIFPEQNPLSEALQEFEIVKNLLQFTEEPQTPLTKVSATKFKRSRSKLLNSSCAGSSTMFINQEDLKSEVDTETELLSPETQKRRRQRKGVAIKEEPSEHSSSSEGEENFRRMKRTLGFDTQNVMKGIGASDNISDKLKKVYEAKS